MLVARKITFHCFLINKCNELICSVISGWNIEETGQVFPVDILILSVLEEMSWFQELATGVGVYV